MYAIYKYDTLYKHLIVKTWLSFIHYPNNIIDPKNLNDNEINARTYEYL